jgi:CRP-like cAMP-binding protein
VKVFSLTAEGEEILLAVRGPGALLGELSAVDGAPRSASVAALEPVVALVAHRGVRRLPPHARRRRRFVLLHWSPRGCATPTAKRVEVGGLRHPGRVARRLVELAERFGEPDGQGVRIAVALSQDELAGGSGRPRRRSPRRCGCCATAGS